MGGIEKITGKIDEEAKIFESVALEQAGRDICEIIDSYNSKAEYIKAASAAKIKKNYDDRIARARSSAELMYRNTLLQMKSELIDEAFEAAKHRLNTLKDDEYAAFFTEIAVSAASAGSGELVFNKNDREKFGKRITDDANKMLKAKKPESSFKLSENTSPVSGGLIIKYGDIEINCSVDTLLSSIRSKVEPKVVAVLFPAKK